MTAPLLKWAGGKRKLARRIEELFPMECTRYVEPFAGSLASFLGRVGYTDEVYLSDVCAPLISFHEVVRDSLGTLVEMLDKLPESNTEEEYLAVRADFNAGGPREMQAARLLWLNKSGFNGLFRTNKKGMFNVPVGTFRKPVPLPSFEQMQEVSHDIAHAVLMTQDFRGVFKDCVMSGTHVYADPPYVPLSATASFTGYAGDGFSWQDQKDLATCCEAAAYKGAIIVVSNHDLPIVREELYPESRGWKIVSFDVNRSISCVGETRSAVQEILAVLGG